MQPEKAPEISLLKLQNQENTMGNEKVNINLKILLGIPIITAILMTLDNFSFDSNSIFVWALLSGIYSGIYLMLKSWFHRSK